MTKLEPINNSPSSIKTPLSRQKHPKSSPSPSNKSSKCLASAIDDKVNSRLDSKQHKHDSSSTTSNVSLTSTTTSTTSTFTISTTTATTTSSTGTTTRSTCDHNSARPPTLLSSRPLNSQSSQPQLNSPTINAKLNSPKSSKKSSSKFKTLL